VAGEEILLDVAAEEVTEEAAAVSEKTIEATETTVAEKTGSLLPEPALKISKHALQRMEERGITREMIKKAIEKGTKYFDPKNGTNIYVLEKAFGSGKNLLVATSQITGTIVTVERTRALGVLKRMLKFF